MNYTDFQQMIETLKRLETYDAGFTRERLTADRTFYVRTDGSDSNTGRANTAAEAFLTVQKAVDVVSQNIDMGGFNVIIQVADGTYTITSAIQLRRYVGVGTVTLQGNTTTPANCVISQSTSGAIGIQNSNGGGWIIQGFRLNGTGGTGAAISGDTLSYTQIGNIEFNTNWGQHIVITSAQLNITAACSILAGCATHIVIQRQATCRLAATITLTGTLTFSTRFAYIANGSNFVSVGGSYTGGTITGTRHLVENLSVASIGSTTFFPGSVAGTPNALSTLSASGGVIV